MAYNILMGLAGKTGGNSPACWAPGLAPNNTILVQ